VIVVLTALWGGSGAVKSLVLVVVSMSGDFYNFDWWFDSNSF